VVQVGEIKSKYAMPYESDLIVCICRDLKYPYKFFWNEVKFFI